MKWWIAVLAVVVAMSACGSSGGETAVVGEEQVVAADDLAQAPTGVPESLPDASADQEPDQVLGETEVDPAGPAEPAVFAPDAPLVDHEFGPIDAGTHRVDTLGTPFSFRSEGELFVQFNQNGSIFLTASDSRGPDDRDIVMMRATALGDPDDLTTSLEDPQDGWPATDFAGWLDTVGDAVMVTNRQDTLLGGYSAIRADLVLGEAECGGSPACVDVVTNYGSPFKGLLPGSAYRMWMVEQGSEAPIAVVVGIDDESKSAWFDTAEQLLATFAFSDIAPNPLVLYPPGPTELALLGGVRIDLFQDTLILRDSRGFSYFALGTEFLVNPLGDDGQPHETIDSLIAALDNDGVDSTELAPVPIGGFDARVFDIENRGAGAEIMLVAGASFGWFSPPVGRLWIVDHPERGIFVLTAWGAGLDAEEANDESIAYTERILSSLEFVELE